MANRPRSPATWKSPNTSVENRRTSIWIPLPLAALASLAGMALAHAQMEDAGLPPEGPRDFSAFAKLMARSPFMMPSSGGENSPLSQRFTLTGAAKINDKPHVFLLDTQNQSRLILSPGQPDGDVELVSFEENAEASKVRAVIRVGTETASLSFGQAQLAPPPAAPGAPAESTSPALTSAAPTSAVAPANNPALTNAQTNSPPQPSAADLQAAGISPGTPLQVVPPRRILRRNTNIPTPANTQ